MLAAVATTDCLRKFAARIAILPTWGSKGLLNILPSPAEKFTHRSLLTLIFVGELNRDSRDRSVMSRAVDNQMFRPILRLSNTRAPESDADGRPASGRSQG